MMHISREYIVMELHIYLLLLFWFIKTIFPVKYMGNIHGVFLSIIKVTCKPCSGQLVIVFMYPCTLEGTRGH